jgi:arabinogalactan oligomer/maltooligosaccharide transport system permease protein
MKHSLKKRRNYRVIEEINTTITMIIFIIISLFVLYPLVYVVSAAFSPGTGIASVNIIPFGDGFTVKHFVRLFTETLYGRWFLNTLYIATSTSLLTVLITSIAAYAYSRFNFSLKKPFLMSYLILQIFPSFVGMVAIYVILLRINGLDTLWGLVLVYVAGNLPYNTWLVKNYMDTVSRNLDEAARIDGAGHFRIFFSIMLPVAKPVISFLAITSFTAPWMDYIFPRMVLRSVEKQTLALGLFGFVTDKKNEFTTFAAGSLIVAIPFIIFFLLSQRFMVNSFSGAAVKE